MLGCDIIDFWLPLFSYRNPEYISFSVFIVIVRHAFMGLGLESNLLHPPRKRIRPSFGI